MKKINILLILAASMAYPLIAQQNASPRIILNSAVDSACYAIGINYGTGLGEQMKSFPGGEANLNALAEGFVRAITGDFEALLIEPDEAQAFLQSYIMDATVKEAEAAKEEENRFLVENKNREGVITTESGLQYKIITQGEGDKPTIDDRVTVNYTGVLLDGTVFDSSERHGEPLTIGITQVISGWTELLQLIPVGSKCITWIPAELGYGAQGAGQAIKPNTMLIYEIELLNIEK